MYITTLNQSITYLLSKMVHDSVDTLYTLLQYIHLYKHYLTIAIYI